MSALAQMYAGYLKRNEIAVKTLRNLAKSAEESAAAARPGSGERSDLYDYADHLWRAYTHACKAADAATQTIAAEFHVAS